METHEQTFRQDPGEPGPRIVMSKVISSPRAAKSIFGKMDPKKKFEAGLLLFLVPLFLYLLWANLLSKPTRSLKSLKNISPEVQAVSPAPGLSLPESVSAREGGAIPVREAAREEGWVRNPFSLIPVREKQETSQRLLLQGTMISPGGEALAILNNKVVKTGDELADNQIESVGDGYIILRTPEGDRVRLDTSF